MSDSGSAFSPQLLPRSGSKHLHSGAGRSHGQVLSQHWIHHPVSSDERERSRLKARPLRVSTSSDVDKNVVFYGCFCPFLLNLSSLLEMEGGGGGIFFLRFDGKFVLKFREKRL